MGRMNCCTRACGIFFLWVTMAITVSAQTLTTLHVFSDTDGKYPIAGLLQGTDGNLYSIVEYGGTNGMGTVFSITTTGTLTTLYNFNGTDGAYPVAGLLQDSNGTFYGTTVEGGATGGGIIFNITSDGEVGTTYDFCSQRNCTDGASPTGTLLQGAHGKLYGTTDYGGTNDNGTVFSVTAAGALKTLQSFADPGGYEPFAGLAQGADGKYYGTTQFGGTSSDGTIFSVTSGGTLETLYSFGGADGEDPVAGLVQGTDGNFYGTTQFGGAYGYGTVFNITPGGKLETLYSFCAKSGCIDGAEPTGALVQGTDGDFYGTTFLGGANCPNSLGCGTIFRITSAGAFATLYSFCSQDSCADGIGPYAGLIQDTDGGFYGTTEEGGAEYSYGTVFSLSVGLGPFIETRPASGNVGTAVTVLGTNLTDVTNVRFNGIEAKFTIVSASEITATVPKGATTGPVRVITPGGKLQSNIAFRVNS
jgi:uncharacterized repeat protein (TIGR03803 family)